MAKIERISMDGDNSTRKALHSTNLVWPNGITIDYNTQTLYWVDASLDKIESSNVDGSNRALVTTNRIFHPFGITYHNGYLYWSDWENDQIIKTNLFTPDDVTVLVSRLGSRPMGLEVVTTLRQPICKWLLLLDPCLLQIHNPPGYLNERCRSCERPQDVSP